MFILKERAASDNSRGKVDKEQSLWTLQNARILVELFLGKLTQNFRCFRAVFPSFLFFSETNISMTVHHENKGIKTGSHNEKFFFVFPLVFSSFSK